MTDWREEEYDDVSNDIRNAGSDKEALAIEAELIAQTDNGLHDGDPEEQP